MIGITDTEGFNNIKLSAKNYSSDISTYTLRMITGCDNISGIFEGNDMKKLISDLSLISDNLNKISQNVGQNTEFLEKVQRTYEKQDEEVSRSVKDAI